MDSATEAADAPARIVVHDGWGELILSRPGRRNALTGPMADTLRAGLAELLAGGARAILLRGEGGAFCSGLDVDAFGARPAPAWRETWPDTWTAFHRELHRCPAVIVGALERFAINGGASLALACDLLVAGEGAFLTVGEAAIGMHAPMNVAWLRLKVGEAVAAQLCLGAERVRGADLHRLGLAWKVTAAAEVEAAARAQAVRLAAFPGAGLASIKAAMRRPIASEGDIFDAVAAAGSATAPPSRLAPRS